jgi:Holliday junction resolvase-like predicted endonuclease
MKRKTALVLLIGEQPLPNLLPTRHIAPDIVVLVHTNRTKEIAERLNNLLPYGKLLCEVDPYQLPQIEQTLQDFLSQHVDESKYQLLFNLTGGTKPMSLAAFQVAAQRQAPFVYFQTEGGRSLLYYYQFNSHGRVLLVKEEELSQTITLHDYLCAQVGHYTTQAPRNAFEWEVYRVLQQIPGLQVLTSVRPQGLGALEVDFVIRWGNQIGVIEAKTKGAKSGIDQIQAVAEQRYLGTYVAKFLISANPVDRNNKNLAQAYGIEVIELTSYGKKTGKISPNDEVMLCDRIIRKMMGR